MKIAWIASALALPFCAFANNVESWNTVQAEKKFDWFSAGVSEESRIGVDQAQTTKKMDEFHTTAFANFPMTEYLSVGVQDDYVLLRDGSDARYRHDNRPGVNGAASWNFDGFKVLNRSRFVMRDIQGERPYFRYRNLTKAYTPPLCGSKYVKDVKLFAAYEWYFDEGSKDRRMRKNDKFCQFWTDFGVSFGLPGNCSMEIFYRLVEVKSSAEHDWSPGHAVCACFCVFF